MDFDTDRIWTGRAVLHVDMDAFFASVEQLDHPEWRGKPVIVGGEPGNRGVVSTCSYEARKYGIRSAMPSTQAARLCPDAIWVTSRFGRYGQFSRAVRDIFGTFTPRVEATSIDEAYLDVSPAVAGAHPVKIAGEIQAAVDALGLSCSIGVASSKTTAKIASDFDKPHGITVVWPGTEQAFLAPLPVRALPGVGAASAARLKSLGIKTVGQLAALDAATVERVLGTWGPELLERAGGVDAREVCVERDVKSVSNEHTFSTDVRQREDVERALGSLVSHVASRLRKKGLSARTFTVKLRYADFSTPTIRRTVEFPTDLAEEMLPVALDLLRTAWSPGAGLRLLGFGASGFDESCVQMDLFSGSAGSTDERPRRKALAAGVDAVKARFGDAAIRKGADIADRRENPDGQPE